MAKTIIRAHMKQRRDTAVNWQAQNPILLDGEIGIVTDQPDRYKVGDGVTEWNALPLRGFDGNIVQMTGGSRTAVMSQLAVTQALEEVENNMLKSEDLTAATKDLASKAELSGAVETLTAKVAETETGLNEAIEALTAEVITNEEITAAALNDLNSRIDEAGEGADVTIDAELSTTSENPVQNKAITQKLNEKQDALVSGTSIKTINGQPTLGSGDLTVVTDLTDYATKAEVSAVSDTVTTNKTATDASIQSLAESVATNKTSAEAGIASVNARVDEVVAGYSTKAEVGAALEAIEALTAEVVTNEEVTAAAFNDLNAKIAEILSRLEAMSV
jgi:hypothetical protein